MTHNIFILDIDGVLVDPQGYRKASQATLDRFTRQMGIDSVMLTDEILDHFEAQNISSEFDIVPLCLAEIFDEILTLYPDVKLPGDLYQACDRLYKNRVETPRMDLPAMAARVNQFICSGSFPSERALEASQIGSTNAPFMNLCSHPLLDTILQNTRDVRLSPITRIFQQFVLGSKTFQDIYEMPAEIETNSFLEDFDQPLLEKELAELLMELWNSGVIDLVAYTGRPSALIDECKKTLLPFSPEANLALNMVGLAGIPLLGLGQVFRLAELTGGNPDDLGKPSLISSLGAIGAAVSRKELDGLMAAERWINQDEADFFRRLPALDIHIFEDTPGGIRTAYQAAEMLSDLSISTSPHAWGIARSADKVRSLQSAGAEIEVDINAGICAALKSIKNPGYTKDLVFSDKLG